MHFLMAYVSMCSCVFRQVHAFEMVTLNDQLICATDNQDALQSHLVHILKVNLSVCVYVSVYSISTKEMNALNISRTMTEL